MLSFKEDRAKILDGQVIRGLGAARGNLAAQLSLIAKEYPEIDGCFLGTINLRLAIGLEILKPDYVTSPIEWMPGVIESFALTKVNLEFTGSVKPVTAWIYAPQLSPHRTDRHHLELIAAKIDAATPGVPIRLHVSRSKARLHR